MIASVAQRWREKRETYRPAGEVIDTRGFDVALIPEDNVAKAFVLRHHYADKYPAARARVGLYQSGELVGVLVATQPMHDGVLSCLPGTDRTTKAELGRFVLLREVPGNGETWFLARAFELLRRETGLEHLVSFSDPVPRTDVRGGTVFPGHVGGIYQAASARFVGRGSPGTLYLLPDGQVLSRRAISKIRARDRGCVHAVATLVRWGAERLDEDEDPVAWLAYWLPRLTRTMRHPGNWKYLFGLDTRARRALARAKTTPPSLAYPKMDLGPRLVTDRRDPLHGKPTCQPAPAVSVFF